MVVEREFPAFVQQLPTIVMFGQIYSGLGEIMKIYEKLTGVIGLLEKAIEFAKKNPGYRITDRATHKRVVI